MYTRKQIRYSIARCRQPGEHPEQYQKIFDFVKEFIPAGYDLDDFPEEWDVMVSRNGEVVIVEPERDIGYIQSTCAEAKVLSKHGINFDDLNDRQLNIVRIVETSMLEGLMDWTNYGDKWRVTLDTATGSIGTQMIKTPLGQKAVTDEMIEKSSQAVDPNTLDEETKRRIADKEAGITYDKTINLSGGNNWQAMTPEEVEALEKIRKKGGSE